ncbi:protease complex subunit PrcB family protein [Peribacillus sp. SCS-155]|uniref:protease complex subunit PrcB family protein n=1 Tax=Peribacillus sedimenti TaxID=3115297 RepID=UPI0039066ABD
MKKILAALSVFFLISTTSMVSAEQNGIQPQKPSQEFQVLTMDQLTESERAFVENVKTQKGIHKEGSLYVFSLGPKPSSGYGLRLVKQEQIFEQLKLYFKEELPEKDKKYLTVITYPYVVGRVNLPPYTTLTALDSDTGKPLFDNPVKSTSGNVRTTTDVKKVWTVDAGRTLRQSDLKNFKVNVRQQGSKSIHPVKVYIDSKNKKALKIQPLKPYKKGVVYNLLAENKKWHVNKIISFIVQEGLSNVVLEYSFDKNLSGWAGGFADLPVNYKKEDYALRFGYEMIPLKGEALKKGLMLSGMNRSDDLFMYAKKKIGQTEGLVPDSTYLFSMEVEFYTNVEKGLMGVGGSPGESVYVKAGVSPAEPKAVAVKGNLQMNVNKGNQAVSGTNAQVIGNIAKNNLTGELYEMKKLKMAKPIIVKTDSNGELWAFFGTDSGFEGLTTLYYSNVKITLAKQGSHGQAGNVQER